MPTSINHLITSSFWLLCGMVGEAARVGHKFTEANVHRLFLFVPSWSLTRMLEEGSTWTAFPRATRSSSTVWT